ncbi:cytochrome P450 [Virgisporangium aliadipatigenens]|uniref:Cytochrome P450 n=1 Tax=Virgisporangium aliadipatigenens TaxID=741659 RepID=A0A8J4DN99_9ACTN|nr:cytochrome P450 [Virgisporangium aliadipatigenens]GIJ43348.1 cytochrome P450 [Virgisporangium aliadipatigenens]
MTTALALAAPELLLARLCRPRPVADPYPLYEQLRAAGPVVALDGEDSPVAVVTGYAECAKALRDNRFAALGPDYHDTRDPAWRAHPYSRAAFGSLLLRDGALHAARRGVVSRFFTPRRVAGLRDGLVEMLEPVLDRMAARADADGAVDLHAELAMPFAARVLCRLLGVPDEEADALAPLMRDMSAVYEFALTETQWRRALDAGAAAGERLRRLAAQRRARPGDDVVSALVAAHGPDDEVLAGELALLMAAGFDSPASLTGLGLRLLLAHPDQAAALREDPALGAAATEEVLRADPPVQVLPRIITDPVELGERGLAPGTLVLLVTAAANRDPSVVAAPERFDIRRTQPAGLGFGGGIHYCLGAAVGRLQGEVLFPRVLRRFPRLALAAPPAFRAPGTIFRGVDRMPVRLY